MNFPILSIVIPNYNYAFFLEELLCKLSLLSNRSLIEVILIDGKSTDQSLVVAKRYLTDSDILISEPDRGQAEAIQKGLFMAKGKWFCFQNSDDLFHIDTLDKFLSRAAEYSIYDVIAFDKNTLHQEGDKWTEYQSFIHINPIRWQQMYFNLYYTNQSTIYDLKKSLSIGFNENLKFAMDYDFAVRFFKVHSPNVALIHDVLGVQRHHANTKTANVQSVCLKEARRIRKEQFSYVDILFGFLMFISYHIKKRLIMILSRR